MAASKKGSTSTKRTGAATRQRAERINAGLAKLYPNAHCELKYGDPLQLLVATILSAQCTDKRVNEVTPALFARYPDAAAFAAADRAELESMIQSTGFFRNKAKNIQQACERIVTVFGGQVPGAMDELLTLAGVARKTANVVLGNAFGVPGITVDTHVGRLSRRMGLTEHESPEKVEAELAALIPREDWTMFSHRMIFHGRRVCAARKPACDACSLANDCPKVGVET